MLSGNKQSSRVDRILAGIRQDVTGPESLAERLCVACAEALPVKGVGMALMSAGGHLGAIAASNGAARVMEDLQLSIGEGPCIDASREGRAVLQPDLASTAEARWPLFGPAVLEEGVAAIFALPLQVGAIRLGILDLYRETVGSLDPDQLAEALAFAEAAVVVLLHLQENTDASAELHPNLSVPVETASEIHQATGMITVQAGIKLGDALARLKAHAYAAERPVLDVAQDVVARRLRFAPEDDHHE